MHSGLKAGLSSAKADIPIEVHPTPANKAMAGAVAQRRYLEPVSCRRRGVSSISSPCPKSTTSRGCPPRSRCSSSAAHRPRVRPSGPSGSCRICSGCCLRAPETIRRNSRCFLRRPFLQTHRREPAAAISRAIVRPIPRAAPVTTATLFGSRDARGARAQGERWEKESSKPLSDRFELRTFGPREDVVRCRSPI